MALLIAVLCCHHTYTFYIRCKYSQGFGQRGGEGKLRVQRNEEC